MSKRLLLAAATSFALLMGCTPPPAPPVAGPPAQAEPASRELLERLAAGDRANQSRWVTEGTPEQKLLDAYDGKSLTVLGTLKASRDDEYVRLTADTEAGPVRFMSRDLDTDEEAEAFIRGLPIGKPATITFNVVWRNGRFVDGDGTPFVFVSATPK